MPQTVSALGPIDPSTISDAENEKHAPWIVRKLVGVSSTMVEGSELNANPVVDDGQDRYVQLRNTAIGRDKRDLPFSGECILSILIP
jgi:hypothetical protein